MDHSQLHEAFLQPGDPFYEATFSPEEQTEASKREERLSYLAGRFAGKEAICKCLGLGQAQKRVLLCEISILTDADGAPVVQLTGALKEHAAQQGITHIMLSLSHDRGQSLAFAVALCV